MIAVVSDAYLESPYCRAEFEYFQERELPVTAVIARDFSTEKIASFSFSDWIDFRRWFDDPSDLSVESLLSLAPQSDAVAKTGERLDYLRGFVQDLVLALAKMPTSWASLRNAEAKDGAEIRPLMIQASMLRDWDFIGERAGKRVAVEDLLAWSREKPQFILSGESGSGKTCFARLLALQQAQAAIRDESEPVPIWLDMARWDATHRSPAAFIESQWRLLSYWRHWLEQRQSLIVLENWSDFARGYPAQVPEVSNWIEANPSQRFIVVSDEMGAPLPSLPCLQISGINAARAQRFAGGWLSLDQQNSFRGIQKQRRALIENSQLDSLSLGVELLTADRALAFNQWHENPAPALIALRGGQLPSSDHQLDGERILAGLRQLAWSMTLEDNHRFLPRESALCQAIDPGIIERALQLGLLEESGALLRFHPELLQWHLAAQTLKTEGIDKHLTAPAFTAERGRAPRKWDKLALALVAGFAEDDRLNAIAEIADIDPYLAAICLKRHPDLSGDTQETLVRKLARSYAQNPAAGPTFRDAIADLPNADQTAQLLIAQLSQFNNAQQLRIWREIRMLPLEPPGDFLRLAAEIDREAPAAVSQRLQACGLSLSLAWLVKLSAHADERIRRNAIWMLGEIKYLPTAILLLSCLEEGDGGDHDEIVLALMKFAYSEVLARLLRWSQDHPRHRPAVIRALAEGKRLVTSRLLALADARRLRLNPAFYDRVVDMREEDIAVGLAQLAAESVDLPESIEAAIHKNGKAADLRARVADSITHLPNRQGFQQLVPIISRVLGDPPESTIVAGGSIDALLYGQPLFDALSAPAEREASASIPAALLAQLRQEDWEKRRDALERLVEHPAEVALPPLLEAAQDEDKRARIAACEILARFESEAPARKAVFAALADPDIAVVDAAAELLKSMKSIDHEALIDLLESENPTAVAAAIDLLRHARQQAAADNLRDLLDDERKPAFRGATIGQLARQALKAIEACPMDGDRASATPGVASGNDKPEFSDEEKIIRTLKVLRDDDWGRTRKAAQFLRRFARRLRGTDNPRILRLLAEALNDDNWSLRWASAEALAMLRDQEAIPALSARIDDPHWIVQVAIVRALAELGATGLSARLAILLHSPRKAVRETAAEALGAIGDRQAMPALVEALRRDADEFVRFAALRAAHGIDPAGTRAQLELALSDSSVHLRYFALRQLAPELNETDLPILKQLLKDDDKPSGEDETVADLARMTLRRIGTVECEALLDRSELAEGQTGA